MIPDSESSQKFHKKPFCHNCAMYIAVHKVYMALPSGKSLLTCYLRTTSQTWVRTLHYAVCLVLCRKWKVCNGNTSIVHWKFKLNRCLHLVLSEVKFKLHFPTLEGIVLTIKFLWVSFQFKWSIDYWSEVLNLLRGGFNDFPGGLCKPGQWR